VGGQLAAARARGRGDAERELRLRRRLQGVILLEHLALSALLLTGLLLMRSRGWGWTRSPWLGLKLGLVAFLVVPLEAMHAWIVHVWIARGLRTTRQPPFARDLERGLGVEEMIRTLAVPLLGIGVPLIVWLSLRQPSS
jgi:hypothetical protein